MQKGITISVEKFLSQSAEKFRRGTLLCFRKFLVPKNVSDKREGGGGYHDFLSKLFCLTVRKKFVGEPFCVSLSSIEKIYGQEAGGGREYHNFLSNIFCLTVPKNFVGEPFCAVLRKISGSEEVYDKKGGGEYQDFLSKIFCLTVPKNFVGEPFRVSLFSGIEKFYASEGYVTIFCRNFFVSQCRKIS